MTPKNDTYPQANDPLTVIGPFAFAAAEMRRNGLAILPVGGDDGKKPLVTGFQAWRGPPGLHTLHLWCHKFPGANIGVSCGPSRILVVDGDEIGLLDRVIGSFGDTPLIISTPRGGFHCYYRDSIGLASMNLRSAGLEFDIKARGGFVVAPPSLNPLRGRSYAFLRDSWDDVGKLPEVEPSAIARLTGRSIPQSWAGPERPVDLVKEGERNRYLFTYLRSLAPYTSEKEVVAVVPQRVV